MALRINRPDGLEKSSDYCVTASVPRAEAELYCAYAVIGNYRADHTMSYEKMTFCSVDWDFTAPLTLTVKPERPWKEVCIRPLHAEIPYTVKGDTIIITLEKAQNFSLELDGDRYRNLFVYACLPAEIPAGENVRVFGPGVHDVGQIQLGAGETVYIDGDAVVFGYIYANGSDIRVCGHGVLSGAKENHDLEKPRAMLFRGENCHDLTVDGIVMLDSPIWTLYLINCRNVTLTDIKQICFNKNSDGFDIVSCENVLITDCFVRNFDDNISIKARGRSNRNIKMEKCILWADCAHNMLVGPESDKNAENDFCHISFRDIDVLEHKEYSEFYKGVMAIFCADNASFCDIEWDGIRIERMTGGKMFDCKYVNIMDQVYGKSVRDVRIKNIDCHVPARLQHKSRVAGMDATHTMTDFVLENIRINGVSVEPDDPLIEIGDFVENLIIR